MNLFKHTEVQTASILKPNLFKLTEMNIQERIAQAVRESGISKSAIAKACGVKPSAVSQWLNGDTKAPTAERLLKLARVTGVSYTWLVEGKGSSKTSIESNVMPAPKLERSVPLVSWVQAGSWVEMSDVDLSDADRVPLPPGASEETFALRVRGQSMLPKYEPDLIIYVDPSVFPFDGDDVVAVLEETNEATFKQLVEEPGGQRLLKARNPAWPDPWVPINGNCKIIGVVVGSLWLRKPRFQ